MKNKFQIAYSDMLIGLLNEEKISIVLSTYQAGKVILLSSKHGVIHQLPVSFKKPMGIATQGSKLAVACKDEVQLFSKEENQKVGRKSDLTALCWIFNPAYLYSINQTLFIWLVFQDCKSLKAREIDFLV